MRKIDIEKISDISFESKINDEFTILYIKVMGDYPIGSKGNTSGLAIYSKLTSIYFLYETLATIILDFSNLDYEWGNTLLKSICFFPEIGRDAEEKNKKIFIIHSSKNLDALTKLVSNLESRENIIFTKNIDEALKLSQEYALEYLG